MKFWIILVLSGVLISLVFAQPDTLYSPRRIPVRTGDSLAADLYSADSTLPKPVVFIQTPYNKATYRLASFLLDEEDSTGFWDLVHYHFVIMDWRGFYGSAPAASPGYDRGLDGFDAIEWIAARDWCDGNVGTYGGSALGAIQFQTARHQPPHLVCSAPWIKDLPTTYFDYYTGGVYRKEHAESHEFLGFITTAFILSHPTLDWVWQLSALNTDYAESIAVPCLMLSGWFDHFPGDVINTFQSLTERSDPPVREQHKLIMGPWTHSQVDKRVQGELEYPEAEMFGENHAKLFFDFYLRGVANGYDALPRVQYFQMGCNDWRAVDNWYNLPYNLDTLFLHTGQLLEWETPTGTDDYDSFFYDPRNPAPVYGGPRFNPAIPALKMGPYDQRDTIEARDDVLVFSTPVLTEDLVISGPITVQLYIASDRMDTDINVRLSDVYPDGRSMILNYGIRRLRFRNGYSLEEPATPGLIYPLQIGIPDIAQTFLTGHRLRLTVTGACYPHFDINLNNGGDMYVPGDTLTALNRVYFDGSHPSGLILPVISGATRIVEKPGPRPQSIDLQCYPNPFNAALNITVKEDPNYPRGREFSQIFFYDLTGRALQSRTLKLNQSYLWTPPDHIPSGIYLIQLRSGTQSITKQVIYLR
ncbi:CocE/NonD family hydrolase [bacterium]|nr:CocE/NonD family hydrolase [bacterium]